LPNYYINILTSITLGMAYGAGAAAPVMFTGAVIFAETPGNFTQPFMTLSYHLFILVNEGISLENAYGSALLLMLLLLGTNIVCRLLEHLREGADWRFGKGK
jgi:phosphate transport system permease protein